MKMRTPTCSLAIIIIAVGLLVIGCASEPHAIEWQKSYGGSDWDYAESIQPTSDGGYIIAGDSKSTDGDVSANHGHYDYWIVKITRNGEMQWQKSVGGSVQDHARSIQQTSDGGYIIAGDCNSTDGNITNHHGSSDYPDYWIVKLSKEGNMQWQKSYGGSRDDLAYSIQQTTDGGYIAAGYGRSTDGDLLNHHVDSGKDDFWILKLSSEGNIEWQKALGGSDYERANVIQQTRDGGYIVAGYSMSNDGEVTGNHGKDDYWIVKLTSAGKIEWQRSLGGSEDDDAYCIQQTVDGGYIVAGESASANGDVTGHHGSSGINDFWVLKLAENGDLEWEKSLGGSDNDDAFCIRQTRDSGYVVVGSSQSSDGDVVGHHNGQSYNGESTDYWIVKLNTKGNIQWQKTLGGSSDDEAWSVLQTSDNGFIIAGNSRSTDGDVKGNHGNADYWIVKLAP